MTADGKYFCYVFEVVDATDDLQYWTLGLFPTLSDALKALRDSHFEDLPMDHPDWEDFCRIEVRQRNFGWGDGGKCVHVEEWRQVYNEVLDEYEWKKEIIEKDKR